MKMARRVNIKVHPSQLTFKSVDIKILLELFPFGIVINRDMRIQRAGEKVKLLIFLILKFLQNLHNFFYNAYIHVCMYKFFYIFLYKGN